MYTHTATAHTSNDTDGTALCQTVERLFSPLARLCLANGMMFAKVEEILKRSFVEAAQALQPDQAQHGMVSRISAATGLNRREVTRLVQDKAPRRPPRQPLVADAIARWAAEPVYRAADGAPLTLNRLGAAPSFETLARSITRDVHPRSILEELLRLGIVSHDQETDQISLLRDEYIPGDDQGELLAFLGDNVGDHLESAVANLCKDDIQHHEQAIYADELSQESVASLAPIIMAHWHGLKDDLVPAITACIEADRQAGRPQDQRVRVGLYSFTEAEPEKENR